MNNKLFALFLVFSACLASFAHAQVGYYPLPYQYNTFGGSSVVSTTNGTFSTLTSGSVVYASNAGLLKTSGLMTYADATGLTISNTAVIPQLTLQSSSVNKFTFQVTANGSLSIGNTAGSQTLFNAANGISIMRIYNSSSQNFAGVAIGYNVPANIRLNAALLVSGATIVSNGALAVGMDTSATTGFAQQISGSLLLKGVGTGSYMQISASAAGITPTTCAGNTEGAVSWSFTNHYMCVCDGTSWKQVSSIALGCGF